MSFWKRRRFDRLLQPHLEDVHAFARRLTRDTHEAEDLVQEAVLAAMRRLPGLRADGAFRVWMFRAVYTTHLDRRDRQARHTRRVEAQRGVLLAFPRDPEDAASCRQLGARLVACLDALPAPQRDAVWLVDVDGLTFTEAASVLGIQRGTVASRVARARRSLRVDLAVDARERGVIR